MYREEKALIKNKIQIKLFFTVLLALLTFSGSTMAAQTSMQIDWGDGSTPIVIDNNPDPGDNWNRTTVKDTVNNVTVTKMYKDSWIEAGTDRIHSWIVIDATDSNGDPDPSRIGPQHVYKDDPQTISIKTFYDSPPDGEHEQDAATGLYYTLKSVTPPSAGATGEDAINFMDDFSTSEYGETCPIIQYPSIFSSGLPAQRPSDAVMPGEEPVFTISYLLPQNDEKRAKTEIYEARWNFTYKLGDLGNKVIYKEGFTVKPEPFMIPSSLDFRDNPENEPFGSYISNIRLFFSQYYNGDTDNEIEITVNKNYYVSTSSQFYNASTDNNGTVKTCSNPVYIAAMGPGGTVNELGPDVPTPIFVVDDKDPVIQDDYSLGAYQQALGNNGVLPCGSKIGAIKFYVYDNNLNIIRYKGQSREQKLKAGIAEMAFKTPIEPNNLPQVDPNTNSIPNSEEESKLSDLQLIVDGAPQNFTRVLGGPEDIEKANRTYTGSNPVFNPGWNGTDLTSWFVRLIWNQSSESKWPQSFKGIIYPKILVKNLGPSSNIGKVLPAIKMVDNIKPNIFLKINKPGNKSYYYPEMDKYVSDDRISLSGPSETSISQELLTKKSGEGYEKLEDIIKNVNPEFEDNNYCWYVYVNIFEKTRYSFSILTYDNITQINNIIDFRSGLGKNLAGHINLASGIKYKWNWNGKDEGWQEIPVDYDPEKEDPAPFFKNRADNLIEIRIPGAKQRRNPTTTSNPDSLTIMIQDAAGHVEPVYNENGNPSDMRGNIRYLKIFFVTQDTKMTRDTIGN